jgi:hypothetical protein
MDDKEAVSISPKVTELVKEIKSLPNVAFGQEPNSFFINDSEYPITVGVDERPFDMPNIFYKNYVITDEVEFFKLAKEGLTMEEIVKRLKPLKGVKIKMASIIDHLERVANTLESKGYIKEAFELDKIADEVEAKTKSVYEEFKTPEPPIVKGEILPSKIKTHETAGKEVERMKALTDFMTYIGVKPHTLAKLSPIEKEGLRKLLDEKKHDFGRKGELYETKQVLHHYTHPDKDSFFLSRAEGGDTYPVVSKAVKEIEETEKFIKKELSSYPEVFKDIKEKRDALLIKYKNDPKLREDAGDEYHEQIMGRKPNPYSKHYFKLHDTKKHVKPEYEPTKLASTLDDIANSIEAKGYIKEAHDLDVISNTLEVISNLDPSSKYNYDNSDAGNKSLAKIYEPKLMKYIKENPGCSIDDIYSKLKLHDIPVYLALHNLVKEGKINGESPYEVEKMSHKDYSYTVKTGNTESELDKDSALSPLMERIKSNKDKARLEKHWKDPSVNKSFNEAIQRYKDMPDKKTVGINEFVKRQTKADFAGTKLTLAQLEQLRKKAEDAIRTNKDKRGYADFVRVVSIKDPSIMSPIVKITPQNEKFLKTEMTKRREGEEEYEHRFFDSKDVKGTPAHHVDLILYTKEQLDKEKEAHTDADYDLISVNAEFSEKSVPISVETMKRNEKGPEFGGSGHKHSPEEYTVSESFWKDHAMVK